MPSVKISRALDGYSVVVQSRSLDDIHSEQELVGDVETRGAIMPTIKNFGFMWERDKVDWGTQARGARAVLFGRMVKRRRREVDFSEQMGIYVLYDRFEQPVQIGQSKNILKRLRQHRRDHLRNRWSYFSWFGFFQVGADNVLLVKESGPELRRTLTLGESLNELEAILIQVLEPRLNRRGSNWGGTEEYLQLVPDSDDNDDESDSEEPD